MVQINKNHNPLCWRLNSLYYGNCWFQVVPLCGCDLCSLPVLSCGGKARLGEDHPDVLISLNNLAVLLHDQGRLAEAEPLYCEALEKSSGAQLQGL